jgi:trimethylamine:corrinoid methyltransferase-like protein
MLEEYEPPPLEDAIEAELAEWVAKRKASFPDSDV